MSRLLPCVVLYQQRVLAGSYSSYVAFMPQDAGAAQDLGRILNEFRSPMKLTTELTCANSHGAALLISRAFRADIAARVVGLKIRCDLAICVDGNGGEIRVCVRLKITSASVVVNVVAEFIAFRKGFNESVRKVLRMRSHESDSLQTFDVAQGVNQVGEVPLFFFPVDASV